MRCCSHKKSLCAACLNNSECLSGFYCTGNSAAKAGAPSTCLPLCNTATDCPTDTICDLKNGVCYYDDAQIKLTCNGDNLWGTDSCGQLAPRKLCGTHNTCKTTSACASPRAKVALAATTAAAASVAAAALDKSAITARVSASSAWPPPKCSARSPRRSKKSRRWQQTRWTRGFAEENNAMPQGQSALLIFRRLALASRM